MELILARSNMRANGDQVFGIPREASLPHVGTKIDIHGEIHGDFPVRKVVVHDDCEGSTQLLKQPIAVLHGLVGCAGRVEFKSGYAEMKGKEHLIVLHGLGGSALTIVPGGYAETPRVGHYVHCHPDGVRSGVAAEMLEGTHYPGAYRYALPLVIGESGLAIDEVPLIFGEKLPLFTLPLTNHCSQGKGEGIIFVGCGPPVRREIVVYLIQRLTEFYAEWSRSPNIASQLFKTSLEIRDGGTRITSCYPDSSLQSPSSNGLVARSLTLPRLSAPFFFITHLWPNYFAWPGCFIHCCHSRLS
jgi:hypothetical protein